jgi:hypothetical protein
MQISEPWIIGALLTVALLTFFFPLATFHITACTVANSRQDQPGIYQQTLLAVAQAGEDF